MYYELLAPGNTEFADNVKRTVGFKSGRLEYVITKVVAAQGNPSPVTLQALLNAMHSWRNQDPHEFSNRGGTNGVAYRLWIEAKQALNNLYHIQFPHPNPPMPPGCPGTELLGVYVPEGEGHVEICHGFAYRWAIAAGKIAESAALPARRNMTAFNGQNCKPVLYPAALHSYPLARAGGVMRTQPGDIIAMFVAPRPPEPGVLGHSLIAATATAWFSANNAGTFGVGTGRSRIDTAAAFPNIAGYQMGWVGAGNKWMRPDGVEMHVVYRRIP